MRLLSLLGILYKKLCLQGILGIVWTQKLRITSFEDLKPIYGTDLQQVNILARVVACDSHTHTQIYLTRERPHKHYTQYTRYTHLYTRSLNQHLACL